MLPMKTHLVFFWVIYFIVLFTNKNKKKTIFLLVWSWLAPRCVESKIRFRIEWIHGEKSFLFCYFYFYLFVSPPPLPNNWLFLFFTSVVPHGGKFCVCVHTTQGPGASSHSRCTLMCKNKKNCIFLWKNRR